jgi:type VI secretion system protein ImpA
MTSTDSLLQPVSSDNPAGDDLSATGALFELETMVVGKPETQFSQAEEADWGAVQDKCIEMLATSKDLRVAVILAATLLKTEGFVGFSNGLAVVRGFLENYWDAFYPRLDPEDNNDPQERVNVLNNLAAPIATSGDPLCVLATLRKVPVTNSREAGNLGLGAILASKNDDPVADGQEAPSAAMVDGAFRDTDRDKLQSSSQAVAAALSHIEAIDAHFSQTVVSPVTPNLGGIAEDLRAIRSAIAPYLEEKTSDTQQSDEGRATASNTENGAPGRGGKLTGSIATREDAVRALDMIIAFYQRSEPSSPIPYLLGRVRRLVPMNFVDLIKDLTPEALEKFSILTGPLDNSE